MALEHCLTVLSQAQGHIEKYPSQAEDAGTNKRTVQHLLTRVLNGMYAHKEVSDTQVALALLNRLGTEATSESFGYYGAGYMHNFISQELLNNNMGEISSDDPSMNGDGDDAEVADTVDDFDSPMDIGNHIPTPNSAELGPAPFYKKPDQNGGSESVPVHYQYHWRLRGAELAMITPAEYYATVEIKKLTKQTGSLEEEEPTEMPESGDDSAERKRTSKKKSRIFRFAEEHPLYDSHGQYLKTKQVTLIFNGFAPPFPGPPPERPETNLKDYQRHFAQWKKKADAFARYYLCSFCPMENVYSGQHRIENAELFTWESLCKWVEQSERSPRLVDRLRLDMAFNHMYGFHSKSKHQEIVSAFRMRSRTIWTEAQLAENREVFSGFKSARQEAMAGDDFGGDDAETFHAFRPHEVVRLHNELQYCRDQADALDSIYGSFKPTVGFSSGREWKPIDHDIVQNCTAAAVKDAAGHLRNGRPKKAGADSDSDSEEHSGECLDPSDSSPEKSRPSPVASAVTVSEYLKGRKLSKDQRRVIDRVREYFDRLGPDEWRNTPAPVAPHLLLTGDPGAGKTYVIETIVELAEHMRVGHVQTSAYNGIAAVNIDGATLCTLLAINQYVASEINFAEAMEYLSEDQVRAIRNDLNWESLALFVVDEVSTIDSVVISLIDARLQRVMGVAKPFGGIAMVFVGDFNQLGAVHKTFLLDDMVCWSEIQQEIQKKNVAPKKKQSKRKRKAVQLDKDGSPLPVPQEKLFRAGQRRVAKTKKQAKGTKAPSTSLFSRYSVRGLVHHGCWMFSNFMRFHISEQQRSDDPIHNQFVQKLASGKNITLRDLSCYKTLSKSDVKNPEWKFAPVLVTTNRERMTIVAKQAQLFAQAHSTYVFKWRNPLSCWKNKPGDTSDLYRANPMLWQYFVPGAEAFLTSNINPRLGLANGTPCTAHSVVLDPQGTDYHRIMEIVSGDNPLPFGSEIILDEAPAAVNMRIHSGLDGKLPSNNKKRQLDALREHSVVSDSDDIVIPISKTGDKFKATRMRNGSPSLSNISSVKVKTALAFDLAFAMTVHKAQGRTMKRVIIALTHRPEVTLQMKFASVFVGMSRVKTSNHLRMLEHIPGTVQGNRKRALSYLTDLLPNKNINIFNAGFDNNNGCWDWRKALKAKF